MKKGYLYDFQESFLLTALVYTEEYKNHETGIHPENNKRIEAIIKAIRNEGIIDENDIFEPEAASENDLLRVHSKEYVERIKNFCHNGGGYLDPDTFASPLTYQTAKLSAGGAIKAVQLVLNGQKSAYSIGRPPGHHATRDRAMGFCFFNNIAIALEYLREVHRIKKFIILDFDVHYGNGTAEIFYNDPHVLYISIHQDPGTIFPGRGFIEEIGNSDGEGYNLNIPLPPGSTTADYIYILKRILKPAADYFSADFYMADVGFDCHKDDPLSGINLDDYFYEWIATEMMDLSKNLALILEGGYNLEVLGRCNLKLIRGLNESEKREQPSYDNMKVHQETIQIFKHIQEVYSPYIEF